MARANKLVPMKESSLQPEIPSRRGIQSKPGGKTSVAPPGKFDTMRKIAATGGHPKAY